MRVATNARACIVERRENTEDLHGMMQQLFTFFTVLMTCRMPTSDKKSHATGTSMPSAKTSAFWFRSESDGEQSSSMTS